MLGKKESLKENKWRQRDSNVWNVIISLLAHFYLRSCCCSSDKTPNAVLFILILYNEDLKTMPHVNV